jgi:hypothetical protein
VNGRKDTSTNCQATPVVNASGQTTSGFGYINMDVLGKSIREGGLFEPTTEWDNETSFDGRM